MLNLTSKVPDSKPDFHQRSVLYWSQDMLNLTLMVPDSKPDFIRDLSYMSQVHVKSESKVPDSKPDFIRDPSIWVGQPGSMFKSTTKVPEFRNLDFIRDPSCDEPGHVKSDVEVPVLETLISSRIRLKLSGTC
ncbi:hypothetical protein AVEN_207271-1 [Araneus ventricosus]|uniref:Uncharacterized protein n=1 Tax=Araneus ventricosus TaxID=182803 RepID=A0A4Y2ICD6_ARAVE|nr:hypothetical protein AVEN_207271-1 [Araneus ventricosus]